MLKQSHIWIGSISEASLSLSSCWLTEFAFSPEKKYFRVISKLVTQTSDIFKELDLSSYVSPKIPWAKQTESSSQPSLSSLTVNILIFICKPMNDGHHVADISTGLGTLKSFRRESIADQENPKVHSPIRMPVKKDLSDFVVTWRRHLLGMHPIFFTLNPLIQILNHGLSSGHESRAMSSRNSSCDKHI